MIKTWNNSEIKKVVLFVNFYLNCIHINDRGIIFMMIKLSYLTLKQISFILYWYFSLFYALKFQLNGSRTIKVQHFSHGYQLSRHFINQLSRVFRILFRTSLMNHSFWIYQHIWLFFSLCNSPVPLFRNIPL